MTPCIIFSGAIRVDGYGWAQIGDRKGALAHRVAYCQARGIPLSAIRGIVVRHVCDNRACINGEHLLGGTQAQNIQDKLDRGRQTRGISHGTSRLTEEAVREIRASRQSQHGLAQRYGVCQATVADVIHRVTWTHI